jgi:chemotaxis protein CheD
MTDTNLVTVNMAEMNVVKGTGGLRTTGLGSCVGVALYDPLAKVAGLAHVMLPNSEIARETTIKLAKYADLAIPELIRRMCEMDAAHKSIQAKLAGGAQMFAGIGNTDILRIGPRNIESCKDALAKYHIPIVAEDTGGHYGRTIELYCVSGKLVVRSVQRETKEL